MTVEYVSFTDLRTAAFCPRQCYYRRTRRNDGEDDPTPPPEVTAVRGLEPRYEQLLAADDDVLEREPIEPSSAAYRDRLAATRDRLASAGHWERLRDPDVRDAFVTGRDCRGIVHKVLADPLEPVLVSAGRPPERGIWHPQSVHAVAAAKALAWERKTVVDRAWIEYPAYGEIRSLELTTRRKARYRRTLRTVRELDGPPPRIDDEAKCRTCEFADECGVRTRSLRSLLGL
ncbi:CRISPR-associated exonuclease Cas4 [Halobiforma haloterrestris]|uniref:CRISPR-associated exonuclease Cas4 n=1 Tax=Natronobacterium haloterrestre TaxID=148448 RepID=A0A1I1GX24_NATHA|nr:hypothetical protein [Halobiforma haloterrestris]SFC15842.1 CRISPR-associated exonuclease Cas4 [Halobiforma haloterrestris]